MTIDAIKTVAVLGAGTMGNGIAHVFARAGYSVILRDVEERFLQRGMETIGKNLDREVKKGKLAETEKPEVLARLKPVTDMGAIAAADFAVEAVPEKMEIKRAVLTEADRWLRPEVILTSNTSSISVTTLAAMTKRPERFVGMHFMNPVPMMVLVEVIRALQTGDEAFATTMELAKKLGKTPVAVNDAPGFVSNRVLMPLINEAAYAVMEGVATPEAVDAVMKLGMNHPMGPLELADFIRPGCVRRHHARAAGRLGRSEVSRMPVAKEVCSRGLAGTQERPRILQLHMRSTVVTKRLDIVLHSDFPPETCKARLAHEIDVDQRTLFSLSGYKGNGPILGRIHGNEFRLHKRHRGHNAWGPVLFGRIMNDGHGARVEAYWGTWKWPRIYIRIWLGFAIAIGTPIFLVSLREATREICSHG